MIDDSSSAPRQTGKLSGLHHWLGGFPTAFFTLSLITDIAYLRSANLTWQYFSTWLIVAALVTGLLAVVVGIVDWLTGPRGGRGAGWHFGLTLLALLAGLANVLVHSRDGWTAVVPEGIFLSVVTVALLYAGGIAAGFASRRAEARS